MPTPPSDRPQANPETTMPATGEVIPPPRPAGGPLMPAAALAPALPAAVTSLPPALNASLDAGALVTALRRRWLLAITLSVTLASAVGAGVWFGIPPRYTVQSTMLVAASRPYVVQPLEGREQFSDYQRTQMALVKSRRVLNAAVRDDPRVLKTRLVHSQQDPMGFLEKEVVADFKLAPQILRISMVGDDPEEQTVIVNAVREAYLKEIVNRDEFDRSAQVQRLQDIYNTHEETLRKRRQTLQALREALGSADPKTHAEQEKILLEHLSAAQKDARLIESEIRKTELEGKTATGSQTLPQTFLPSEQMIEEEIRKDRGVMKCQADIDKYEEKIAVDARLLQGGENNPRVRDEIQMCNAAKNRLKVERDRARVEAVERLGQRSKNQGTSDASQAARRLQILKAQQKDTAAEVKEVQANLGKLRKSSSDVEAMSEEITRSELYINRFADRIEQLKLELQAPGRITVLETAGVAGTMDNRQVKITSGAAGFTFVLALFGVCWWDFRGRRVAKVDDVTRGLGLRLMGSLPPVATRPRRRLLGGAVTESSAAAKSFMTESVDAMRTMLLHIARAEALQSVMVSSALGGEGKTSLACHLATSLTRAGFRTLIVDGDFRRPAAHRVFGLAQSPGLSEALRGEAPVTQLIQPTPIDGLSLLAAGQQDAESLEALPLKIGAVFAEIKQQYNFIVVDSSPVLPVADALLMGQQVDGVIFSVLRDVSRLPSIYAAHERLNRLGIRVLGAVVNGVGQEQYVSAY